MIDINLISLSGTASLITPSMKFRHVLEDDIKRIMLKLGGSALVREIVGKLLDRCLYIIIVLGSTSVQESILVLDRHTLEIKSKLCRRTSPTRLVDPWPVSVTTILSTSRWCQVPFCLLPSQKPLAKGTMCINTAHVSLDEARPISKTGGVKTHTSGNPPYTCPAKIVRGDRWSLDLDIVRHKWSPGAAGDGTSAGGDANSAKLASKSPICHAK